MPTPLPPDRIYPAGVSGVSVRFIELSSGVRARVAFAGPHDGTPVVLLHGWAACVYLFRHGLERLPASGIRAIAVDLRGFGLTDKPTARSAYSIDAYCADLDALLDALQLRDAVFVGQSMGGGLLLRYAQGHGERMRGMVLINPSGLVRIPLLSLGRAVPRPIVAALGKRAMPRWVVRSILRRFAYADPHRVTQRDVDEYWAPTQLDGFVSAARSALSEFDWKPLTDEEAASMAVSSVVILGRKDRLVRNAEDAARRLANSTVHLLDGAHCVNEELPDVVYDLVGRFTRSI
ncbi:MAG TPA: alpha/beta fold hydrolase [Gemmatimonadaceae bacterium]|nr:alpha/beta fold hydrolase [Gemmatimonadaceae bacterium]